MNTMEHDLLIKIDKTLNDFMTQSEHRITKNTVNIKNQQERMEKCIDNCITDSIFKVFAKSIKSHLAFMYSCILTGIAAAFYTIFKS